MANWSSARVDLEEALVDLGFRRLVSSVSCDLRATARFGKDPCLTRWHVRRLWRR